MNFKQFREMLSRGIKKPTEDFGEPESREVEESIAFAGVRSASRREELTIKIKADSLVKMILMAADEPERPWGSAVLRLSDGSPYSIPSMLYVNGNDEARVVEVTLTFTSRTTPVTYAPPTLSEDSQ